VGDALREAFTATIKDPALLDEAHRSSSSSTRSMARRCRRHHRHSVAPEVSRAPAASPSDNQRSVLRHRGAAGQPSEHRIARLPVNDG